MKFYPTLIETLTKRFEPHTEDGLSEIRDISNHGIMGGFNGFIYNYEINEFFNAFESEIEDHLEDLGYTISELVSDSDYVDFQSMRNKAVWIVVESWCHHVIDCVDDTVDQERDLSLVA